MFAGVQRANYILNLKIRLTFKEKSSYSWGAFSTYYHFELVKWFGGIPMKGDASLVLVMRKKFHDLRLQKYTLLLKQT
jgi:hypothetical protein